MDLTSLTNYDREIGTAIARAELQKSEVFDSHPERKDELAGFMSNELGFLD